MNKIFRTLLMIIALVMGVVNVQADPYYEGVGTTSIEFPYGTFDDYDASTTVLRVTYVIQPQTGWTPTYKINLGTRSGAYVSEEVTQNGTVDIPIEGYNNSDINNIAAILYTDWVTITRVEIVSGSPVAQKHTLTITIDGESNTKLVAEGATLASLLPTPTKDDYTFAGWSGLPEDGLMPDHDIEVVAQFVIRKYDVKFYIDNELVETVQYAPGETIAEKEAPDARTGYTFSGWSGYPENKVMPKWDVNISGQFNVNHHYIVYNKDGNYYDGKYNIPYGATIAPDYLPENNPTKDGYVFDHWEGLPETMPDQDLTVEAVFVSTSAPETPTHALKIVVDGNEETKQVPEGAALSGYLPANPTKTGYTFNAWSNMPEGEVMPTEDWEVTATFTINTYHITYMVDGAQYGDVADVVYGADITAPADPTKDGYTFTGWDNLPETMPADNLTINALFDKILNIGENETVIWDGTPAIVYGGETNLFVKNTDDWLT
ncbi:MAG: InlB B-repeat-containing protein, partial [Prevotella sp.]|nr:InlB B-repeat-containing protein [Prevotella sp.]